jgi:hypothetical protein
MRLPNRRHRPSSFRVLRELIFKWSSGEINPGKPRAMRLCPNFPIVFTSSDRLTLEEDMHKRFISTSTHILDPANPSTPPTRPSPPPAEKSPLIPDPNDKRTLFDKLSESKAKKQEAFEEAYKFSSPQPYKSKAFTR